MSLAAAAAQGIETAGAREGTKLEEALAKLTGAAEGPPIRKATKARLREYLQSSYTSLTPRQRKAFEDWKLEELDRERAEEDWWFRPWSCARGIQAAQCTDWAYGVAFGQGVDAHYFRGTTERVRAGLGVPTPELEPKKKGGNACIETHCRIDLRDLAKLGYVKPGEDSHFSLYWAGDGGPPGIYLCSLRLTSRARVLCVDLRVPGRAPSFQSIEVGERDRRNRYAFLCPATGERVETLFLRKGVFASGGAHGLVYARGGPAKRGARRPHS